MRIIKVKEYEEMSMKAAQLLISQVILKPDTVFGLATGSTPLGTYQFLVKHYQAGLVDFADVRSFNLDEYYPIAKSDENSYYRYMYENLFNHINVSENNIYIPHCGDDDTDKLCKEYDALISDAGGIDIQLLGIGRNGHIGFNEPDIKFEAGTHVVHLDDSTIEDNARFFNSIDEVPREAISMGIKNIMQSKKIVLLASGKEKAEAVAEMINGPITPNLPASVLQLHPDVVVIVDEGAGSKL